MGDPLDDVDAVTDQGSAARLRVEFEHVLRTNSQLSPDELQEYRDAIAELDSRWPGAHEHAMTATETELYGPGGMPGGYRRTRHQLRQEHGVTASSAAAARRRRAGPSSPGSTRRQRAAVFVRSAGSEGATAGRSAYALSGADSVVTGAGDIALATIRLGLALALAYFLLGGAKGSRGPAAFASVLGSIATGVRALIAPVDPLSAGDLENLKAGAFNRPNYKKAFGGSIVHLTPLPASVRQRSAPANPAPTPNGAAIFGAPSIGGFPPTTG